MEFSAIARILIMRHPNLLWEKITGTDHSIPHLYDVNTFQCYLSANVPEIGANGAINQAWSIPILFHTWKDHISMFHR
jgi:hypothetical protein